MRQKRQIIKPGSLVKIHWRCQERCYGSYHHTYSYLERQEKFPIPIGLVVEKRRIRRNGIDWDDNHNYVKVNWIGEEHMIDMVEKWSRYLPSTVRYKTETWIRTSNLQITEGIPAT